MRVLHALKYGLPSFATLAFIHWQFPAICWIMLGLLATIDALFQLRLGRFGFPSSGAICRWCWFGSSKIGDGELLGLNGFLLRIAEIGESFDALILRFYYRQSFCIDCLDGLVLISSRKLHLIEILG